MNTKLSHGKGWRPDPPDARDHVYSNLHELGAVPISMNLSLSAHMPPIADQGQLGSCTAFGTLRCFDFAQHNETGAFLNGSHLFQYYNTRAIEGTVNQDAGGTIRDAMKALSRYGVCPEKELPYNIARFKREPTQKDYTDALHHQSIEYLRVNKNHIRVAIASGFPVVFGTTLYESFEDDSKWGGFTMPMPDLAKEQVLGGHCMVFTGYDDRLEMFSVANSWGTGWKDGGYFWMPYAYVAHMGFVGDLWLLRKVENAG